MILYRSGLDGERELKEPGISGQVAQPFKVENPSMYLNSNSIKHGVRAFFALLQA
jgi:hypothetical protein